MTRFKDDSKDVQPEYLTAQQVAYMREHAPEMLAWHQRRRDHLGLTKLGIMEPLT